jgi:hypothetical protein
MRLSSYCSYSPKNGSGSSGEEAGARALTLARRRGSEVSDGWAKARASHAGAGDRLGVRGKKSWKKRSSGKSWEAVLGIRIRIFLSLPDPDALVRGMDPDPLVRGMEPDPEPSLFPKCVERTEKMLDKIEF